MSTTNIVVVSWSGTAAHARLTVQYATAAASAAGAESTVHVLDADGSYTPVGGERVLTPTEAGVEPAELHRSAARREPADLIRHLYPALVRTVHHHGAVGSNVLVLHPGMVLLRWPAAILAAADEHGLGLASRWPGGAMDDGLRPDVADLAGEGSYVPGLLALRDPPAALLAFWEATPPGSTERWLDVAAGRWPHGTVREPATVISTWSLDREHRVDAAPETHQLTVEGAPVVALDLTHLDPRRSWVLDPANHTAPRARLSDHPALARVVRSLAEQLSSEPSGRQPARLDLTTTSLGTALDAATRHAYCTAGVEVPDPLDAGDAEELRDWLTQPQRDGGLSRYLLSVHATRPDLQRAFPQVPGTDDDRFLTWVTTYASDEGYPPILTRSNLTDSAEVEAPSPSASDDQPVPGVTVLGFLTGELGIGESARLMVSALDAAGVRHRTVAIDRHLSSRQRAGTTAVSAGATTAAFDTSLICVNADLTPLVCAASADSRAFTYRIGMWYWEVESFPRAQHGGFAHVDEVWAATDFVRDAIAESSPIPVVTVTPPLPQRGPESTLTRADLGLPAGPLFLFSFDYLSTAERKNPLGLIDAFRAAFAPGEGPVLVLKSINAELRPVEAERVRLRAADEPDVHLMERYLEPKERDALVSLCDCYVSLHRSEGLGLTMAEAMAWGKPVIATGYSGNLQFMTDENSFLVPWTPGVIPVDAPPYPAGGVWADPDLDAAATFMRLVVADPDEAAARGRRAARDIAQLHSPEVAGRNAAARLAEIASLRALAAPAVKRPSRRQSLARLLGRGSPDPAG